MEEERVDNSEKTKAQEKNTDRKYWVFAIRTMSEFGGMIAIPAVLFAFLGRYLDARLETKPWMLLLSLAVAFIFSTVIVWRRAKQLGEEYEKL